MDVTFNETPYFTKPYLQRENSILEDKDMDFLFDLLSLPKLVSSNLSHVS